LDVGRSLEIFVLLVGPELRDVRIGVDHRVLELAAHPLHLPDVDVLDRIAEVVHLHGPARVLRDLHLAEGGHELLLVLDLAVDGLQRLVVEARPGVALGGIERGPAAEALLVGGGELPVGRGIERAAVDQRGDDPERLVPHALEHVLVGEGADADERDVLQAGVAPGLQEARREAAGVAGVDPVDVLLQGRQVGRVVLMVSGGPDALNHLAPSS
jgi:hypothetical protein